MRWRNRDRGEHGAVAIMVAMMAVMLMGVAALTVDLSNGFVQRRDVQKRADFAALAGGFQDDLPAPASVGTCPYGARANANDQDVKDVATYLGNQPGNGAVTAAQLVDCNMTNGEAVNGFVAHTTANVSGIAVTYSKNALTVITPLRKVDFGFAKVLGFQSVNVNGTATVRIGSPSLTTLPLYAFSGCDFGGQTIAQPTNGHAAADVLLSHDSSPYASASLSSLVTNPTTNPAQVPADVASPNDSLVLNGTGFTGATQVGFFESGTSGPGPEPQTIDTTKFTVNSDTKITIPHLPTAVTGVPDFWYVRVFVGGKWSPVTAGNGNNVHLVALPLRVGDPTLTCGQGSSAGNFGTLLLQNSQGPNGQADNIAYNIAAGLEHKLGLFPSPHSNWLCTAADVGAKIWPADGTNCVDTKTGLDLNAAQAGFISGVAGKQGLLTKTGAGTGCAANGTPATKPFGAYTINNDTLSCFFTDSTTQVGDVDGTSYSLGAPVISGQIFNSPRFVYVPVLGAQPSNGGSNKYQVIDMRPGFITDQTNSASKSTAATSTNGITGSGSSVDSVQVVFLNRSALPSPPDGGGVLDAYSGTGPKILRLVN